MTTNHKPHVLIIGAGPAGLTAAYELVTSGKYQVSVIEKEIDVGGISRTVSFDGYYMDIGGHRFFTKSAWVLNWWSKFLEFPMSENTNQSVNVVNQNKVARSHEDVVLEKQIQGLSGKMMIRSRKSRILFNNSLYDYPLKLNLENLSNFGFIKSINFLTSYLKSLLFYYKEPQNLEDFFIKTFGKALYLEFFKNYTEKVWGKQCYEISAEWGKQRVRGLSLLKMIQDYFLHLVRSKKDKSRSLITHFYYPELGPGQLWKNVKIVCESEGVKFQFNSQISSIKKQDKFKVKINEVENDFDIIISSAPINILPKLFNKELNISLSPTISQLEYRNIRVAGVLIKKISSNFSQNKKVDDTWIYVQDENYNVGRIQFFKNWSPHLLKNNDFDWLGFEYFCSDESDLWQMSSANFSQLVKEEILKLGMIDNFDDILKIEDEKQAKAYPSYFGHYEAFLSDRNQLLNIDNFYLIGRNGLHQYNNQDHSMLTAKEVVETIIHNKTNKKEIWDVIDKDDYIEGQ